MREVKIVFHVGKQKTATTYIQNNIKSTKKLIFIGKYNTPNNKFLNKINEIHYSLFPKYPNYIKNSYNNPTRNNYKLLNNYADEIILVIKNNPLAEQIVISDECISDYYNYLSQHFRICHLLKIKPI